MNAPHDTTPPAAAANTANDANDAIPGCNPAVWTTAVLVGVGVVGRELARALASLGFLRFLLVDPKRYRTSNVGTQCTKGDVGRPKVEAMARDLQAPGVRVVPFHGYVEDLPPGQVPPDALVAVSADRLSAVRAASRMAVWLGLPLLRVQVEPTYDLASLEFYDYTRSPVTCCLECGWTQATYQDQLNVHSCEDRDGRPTRSSLALAAMAAHWAALTFRARAQRHDAGGPPRPPAPALGPFAGLRGIGDRAQPGLPRPTPAPPSWSGWSRGRPRSPWKISAGAPASTARPRYASRDRAASRRPTRCPRCGRIQGVLRWATTPHPAGGPLRLRRRPPSGAVLSGLAPGSGRVRAPLERAAHQPGRGTGRRHHPARGRPGRHVPAGAGDHGIAPDRARGFRRFERGIA